MPPPFSRGGKCSTANSHGWGFPPFSRGANAVLLTNMVGVLLFSQCIALNLLFENSSTCNNSLLSPQFTCHKREKISLEW